MLRDMPQVKAAWFIEAQACAYIEVIAQPKVLDLVQYSQKMTEDLLLQSKTARYAWYGELHKSRLAVSSSQPAGHLTCTGLGLRKRNFNPRDVPDFQNSIQTPSPARPGGQSEESIRMLWVPIFMVMGAFIQSIREVWHKGISCSCSWTNGRIYNSNLQKTWPSSNILQFPKGAHIVEIIRKSDYLFTCECHFPCMSLAYCSEIEKNLFAAVLLPGMGGKVSFFKLATLMGAWWRPVMPSLVFSWCKGSIQICDFGRKLQSSHFLLGLAIVMSNTVTKPYFFGDELGYALVAIVIVPCLQERLTPRQEHFSFVNSSKKMCAEHALGMLEIKSRILNGKVCVKGPSVLCYYSSCAYTLHILMEVRKDAYTGMPVDALPEFPLHAIRLYNWWHMRRSRTWK